MPTAEPLDPPQSSSAPIKAGRPRLIDDEAIFEVALRAFSERGFEAVSLRDLNRLLGVSHATLAKRFGSKDALWRAAADFAFARHRDALEYPSIEPPANSTDDLEVLHRFVVRFIATASDHPELQRLINLECCAESERVDYLYDHCISPLMDLVIRPVLDRLTAAGLIRPIGNREVFFVVASGAASVFALGPLSRRFEASSGPVDPQAYAESLADLLIGALRSSP